jgi:transcriptional regulator with XRE-family HTH domain
VFILVSNEFGLYLRELRKSKEMTLRELAKSASVSQSYITNVENKKRGTPSPDILKKLAEALETSYEELMIKAGYWDKKHSSEDKELFERIYNEEADMLERINFLLTKLSDEEGEFSDELHSEIYKIFGGWLPRQYDGMWDFDDYLNDDANNDNDEMSEPSIVDMHNEFNLAYNRKNILKGLKQYNGFHKSFEDVLNELIILADKSGYEVGESKVIFTEIDLNEILSDQSVIIRFNKKLISPKNRYQLIGYIDALLIIEKTMGEDS